MKYSNCGIISTPLSSHPLFCYLCAAETGSLISLSGVWKIETQVYLCSLRSSDSRHVLSLLDGAKVAGRPGSKCIIVLDSMCFMRSIEVGLALFERISLVPVHFTSSVKHRKLFEAKKITYMTQVELQVCVRMFL